MTLPLLSTGQILPGFRLFDGQDLITIIDQVNLISNTLNGAGNQYYVNESTGSDNDDGSSATPFATLSAALSAATANNNDVIFLMGTVHVSATVTWNKNGVHLVGLTAPSLNDRARI